VENFVSPRNPGRGGALSEGGKQPRQPRKCGIKGNKARSNLLKGIVKKKVAKLAAWKKKKKKKKKNGMGGKKTYLRRFFKP